MKIFQSSMFLLFAMLIYSCCKDTEKLIPISGCKIISNHNTKQGYWRYLNYNSKGEIISYLSSSEFYNVDRNIDKTELLIANFPDTTIYFRRNDSIFCNTPKGEILKILVIKSNLISEIIDKKKLTRTVYTYSDNALLKEIEYNFWNEIKYEINYISYENEDLLDYFNIDYGIIFEQKLEYRLVAEFFKLNQSFKRYKEFELNTNNISGQKRLKYQFSYIKNDRDLVAKKIINEVNEGIFKDTVSYTYTCKY